MKPARLLVIAFALPLVAVACGTTYDRDSAYEDLTTDPQFLLSDEEATCVLDQVESQGLEDVVIEDDPEEVDQSDLRALTDIFGQCTLGDLYTPEIADAVEEELNSEGS